MCLSVADYYFLSFQHLFKPQSTRKRNFSVFVDVSKSWFSLFWEAAFLLGDLGIL